MSRRRTARFLTARFVTALFAAAVLTAVPAPAGADPALPGVPLDRLRAEVAGTPETAAALERLVADSGSADPFAPPPLNIPQPFMAPAPTLGPGCGGGFVPFAMTTGWAHPGPHGDVPAGRIAVFVEPTVASPIVASDMKFVWMNMENFRAGVATLDTRPEILTGVIDTGPGAVLAALFGSVRYANGATCQVVYTMGGFFA